ncbi:ribonuclease H-like domain-containing protein [Tanacetum coccineum]
MTSYNNTIGLPAVHTSQGVTNQYNVALSSYFNGSYPFTPNMGFVNFQQSNMAESISHPIPLYSAQPNNLGYVYLQSGLGHYCPSPAQPASYMTHPQANLVSSVPIQPAQVQPQPAQIPIQQAHPYSSSQAFQTMTLQESNWNMDTGASSHLAENTGMLTSFSNPSLYKSVFVGNGQPIPVTHTGHSLLHTPHKPLHLHHVLVTPNIIKNLISVRQFTRDNNVSVDFDAYGFSVKDYQTRRLLLRCDSTGDLYPVTQQPSSTTTFALLSLSPTTWHRRLGHPSEDMLRRLESSHFISYNKTKLPALCHACQLGKHTKLPFYSSESNVGSVFDIIHSDLWTSPISSESGIKYYAIFLDHFSHYVWVYPLLHKSDLFDTFVTFRAYVNKQFNVDIKALQCDHGGEYDNTRFHNLFRQNGMQFRFSCPKTSQQNGKSERMLRTLNNITRTLLFQAHIPPSYWVEALNMAAHLLNILPSTAINNEIPFTKLHNKPPTYDHLRVFGCLCYPHISFDHKLQPRSTACVFLGYPALHRGYRCLDLSTNKIIISRHVIFDEDQFPFGSMTPDTPPSYDFLLPPHNTHTSQTTHPNNHQLHPPTAMPPSPTHTSPTQSPQAQPQSPHHPLTPRTPATHQQIPVPPLSSTHEPTTPSSTPNTHITSPAATAYGNAPTTNTHHMVTRAKAGISKPLARMNCHATTTSPIPRSHLHALRDPNWHKAMVDEYNALISNGTWALVPRPANVNIVRSMWLFKHKFNADGSLSRYKARLVANGRSQQQGIDFDETFSPVVKPATIRTVLSLAVTRDWPIHQLDVKNAFLHGQLSETVYMHQPPGFVDSAHPDYVCHLQRSLYGLKQAPRAWFQRFASFITRVGFQHSKTDTSLFVYHMGSDVAYLLLYVDDIILTASSTALLQRIITLLHSEFAMTDLGSLNYFLGVSAQRSKSGLFLSQSKFAEEILERAHMQHCNPCKTPVDTESKLGSDGDPVSDPTLYRSLAGALQYLTFTRPDISYAVQQICLYMHDPRDPHFTALKRILRYVRGTIDHGLQLYVSSTSQLTAYTDADWAGCPVTRRSTSGYCVFLGDNLLSWSAKRQVTLSRSSAEAEYRGVANVVAETAWIRNLLLELHTPLFTATLVYCDNVSAVYLSTNPVQHQRTKHIEIDIHFVREYVASGQVRVLHVPFRFQYADIFTKGLPTALFLEFRSSLNVRISPAHTEGEY